MDKEFLRYSCQMVLPGFAEATQKLLQDAKVLVVGAGGLGCPAAQYLVSTGVGTVAIADFDTISIGNLHRQILFNEAEVGQKKVVVAVKKLILQNPHIDIIAHDLRITSENVLDIISSYDIVVDGTDNFDTKYLLNDACVLSKKPLVHGAIYQYEGQVAVWNYPNENGTFSPNFRDIFPEVDAGSVPNCAEGGVIPTLAGIIGCMQANEVIKIVTRSKEIIAGKLLIFNAQTLESKIIRLGTETKVQITQLQDTVLIPVITPNNLKVILEKNEADLVDVRTNEERNIFQIGGIHMAQSEFNYDKFHLGTDKPVVLYCASGKRSGDVVKKLKKLYPKNEIFSLDGGLKNWRESL